MSPADWGFMMSIANYSMWSILLAFLLRRLLRQPEA
jgi:hypothetical protein